MRQWVCGHLQQYAALLPPRRWSSHNNIQGLYIVILTSPTDRARHRVDHGGANRKAFGESQR